MLAGFSAALIFAAGSVAASMWLSDRTQSGLFGICGPYGSDSWIAVIACLFLGVPIIGLSVGFFVALRLWRKPRGEAAA